MTVLANELIRSALDLWLPVWHRDKPREATLALQPEAVWVAREADSVK